jgi:hypothetical protein
MFVEMYDQMIEAAADTIRHLRLRPNCGACGFAFKKQEHIICREYTPSGNV